MLNSAVSYDEIVDSFFKKGYYNRVECTKIVDKCIELNILAKTDSINNHYAFDHEISLKTDKRESSHHIYQNHRIHL